jgi:hypothetical protein
MKFRMPVCNHDNCAQPTPDPDLLRSLAGLDADEERSTAQTARRRVAGKMLSVREQKSIKRRRRAIAIMLSVGVLVLITPVIWSSVDSFIDEGHLGDLGPQVTFFIVILFPALLAALIAAWRNRLDDRHGRRNS